MAIDCLDPSGLPDVRLRRAVFSTGRLKAMGNHYS